MATIIVDWDGTLFPTDWVLAGHSLPPGFAFHFNRFLFSLSQCGTLMVVTNADEGWIEHCMQTYMPHFTMSFPHVSAKAMHHHETNDIILWKQKVFESIDTQHMICIGDGLPELRALDALDIQLKKFIQIPPRARAEGLMVAWNAILKDFSRILALEMSTHMMAPIRAPPLPPRV